MAKTCVTEKTARRQEWIENGLLELMQHRRFEEITVTDLCAHLQLSRRSFYRYFDDLEDVLDSALDHIFQNMILPGGLPRIEEMQKNFEFWIHNRSVLDALAGSGMLDRLYDCVLRYSDPMSIDAYLAPDSLDMDIRREASLFVIHGSLALAIAWYSDDFRKTPEEMARIAHRLMFAPILEQK